MNELSPKELYEQKKKEKFGVEAMREKTKIASKILILLAIMILVFGGVYWLVRRAQQRIASRKLYAIQITELGRNHIPVGSIRPTYNSNPPTSGPHYDTPASKGIYDKQLADEQLVHNLEHGYIWISYRPDASQEIIKQLNNFYGFGSKIVVEPRKENDKLVALAAWGWLDKFDPESKNSLNEIELKRIGDFIDTYINQGPEPNAP